MPVYVYQCDACNERWEEIHPMSECADEHWCAACGLDTHRVPQPVAIVGPMLSRPLTLGGVDETFHSNAELRAWEKANPDTRIVTRDDSRWQNHYATVRNRSDAMARRMGYRDIRHKQQADRVARSKGKVSDMENQR